MSANQEVIHLRNATNEEKRRRFSSVGFVIVRSWRNFVAGEKLRKRRVATIVVYGNAETFKVIQKRKIAEPCESVALMDKPV